MLATALYAEVYAVCVIVIGLLLIWNNRGETNSAQERCFGWVLTSFFVSFLSNLLFALVNGGLLAVPMRRGLAYALKTVCYIGLILGVFFWCVFADIELRRGGSHTLRHRKAFLGALALPLALMAVNLFTRCVFDITEDFSYQRLWGYHLLMFYMIVCALALGVRMAVRAAREFDPNRQLHMLLAASFPVCLIAAWLLSFLGEAVPVVCVCVTIQLLCLYVGNNRQQISMDKLTQVNNRQNLIGFINYKLNNHDGDLYLLMIDIDFFKTINDTYGHLEGDEALVRVASALKMACGPFKKRPFIARYGGDEFIIVMEGDQEDVARLCDGIRDVLKRKKAESALSYDLNLTIGYAKAHPGETSKELIAAADAALYKIKDARGQKRR